MNNKSKDQKLKKAAEDNEAHLQQCSSFHCYWPSSHLMTKLYFHLWLRQIAKKIDGQNDEKSLLR